MRGHARLLYQAMIMKKSNKLFKTIIAIMMVCFGFSSMAQANLPSGLYVGVTGFNQALYSYPLGQLNSETKSGFDTFIDNLEAKNGTLLYYSVDKAIAALKDAKFPSDLSNVAIVTFTDGLDQGSMMMNTGYPTDELYLTALNQKIMGEMVSGCQISAYSIGVLGGDVTDVAKFRKNLSSLASSSGNTMEVTNMEEVNVKFQEIANQLIEKCNVQTLSLIMPGQANGTKVRFTFDGVSNASNSQVYIEGTFNISDYSLKDIKYKGLKATSGSVVYGEVDNIFVKFTFDGIETDTQETIQQQNINQWIYIPSTSLWQINSEFDNEEQSEVETRKQSAAIMLVLDCSSSLGESFTDVKEYAKSFISTLAYYSIDRQEDIFPMIGHDDMIRVDGGVFMMGAQSSDSTQPNYDADAASDESPVHQVTLDDFLIGKYEVTQKLWEYVMNYSGEAADGTIMAATESGPWFNGAPDVISGLGDNYPVYNVNYYNVVNGFISLE